MDDIEDVFYLTTVEQARTIADNLRLRLLEALQREPLTVTQLGERVGESPAKVHYHVRELERIGVVRLVETRERGGILEKYYRAVAKSIQVAPDTLQTAPRSEVVGMLNEWFSFITREALRAVNHHVEHPNDDVPLTLSNSAIHATQDEFRAVLHGITDLLRPFEDPRGVAGEREWMVTTIAHQVLPSAGPEQPAAPPAAVPPIPPIPPVPPISPVPPLPPVPPVGAHKTRSFVMGAQDVSRAELEGAVAEGRTLEMTIIGLCRFADDIPAELVDRAVARFRHWGQLIAPPAVREVLSRKGGGA